MIFDFSTLITDRTMADVDAALGVINRVTNGTATSEEQQRLYDGLLKGMYDFTDLNRVTACMEYLDAELRKLGYESGYKPVKIIHPELPPVYDKNTILMLHGQDLTDSSQYSVPITNQGVQVSSEYSKFGGKSLYFNGSAMMQAVSDRLDLRSTDFTVDWWEFTPTYISRSGLWCFGDSDTYGLLSGYVYDGLTSFISSNGESWDIANILKTGSTLPNQWVHRAIVRNGNKILFFENGTMVSSVETSLSLYQNRNCISFGRCWHNIYAKAYIDEFRVSNVARWVENFTPPDVPYGLNDAVLDPYRWYREDAQIADQMERFAINVQSIKSTLAKIPGCPEVPNIMSLSHTGANDIEAILMDINKLIENVKQTINLGWTLGIADIGLYGGIS